MDSSNAEKATDLDGATTPPPENAYPSDAGQFAARWNAHTPEFRDGWVRSMIKASQTASNCYMEDHEGLLQALAESRARFADSEARRAELEAVIEKATEVAHQRYAGRLDILDVLETAPSVVLEDRDRENRAIGWDEGERHESEYLSKWGQFCPGEHCNPHRGDKK